MIIMLKYGAGRQLIVNPVCAAYTFSNYLKQELDLDIRTHSGLEPEIGDLDLCNSDGILKGLAGLAAAQYVSALCTNKEVLVPVVIERDLPGGKTNYRIMLHDSESSFDKINTKLNFKGKKMTKASKGGMKSSLMVKSEAGNQPSKTKLSIKAIAKSQSKKKSKS